MHVTYSDAVSEITLQYQKKTYNAIVGKKKKKILWYHISQIIDSLKRYHTDSLSEILLSTQKQKKKKKKNQFLYERMLKTLKNKCIKKKQIQLVNFCC